MGLFSLMSDEDFPEDMEIEGYEGALEGYVREYDEKEHRLVMKKTQDYLDPRISMEEWYGGLLFILEHKEIRPGQARHTVGQSCSNESKSEV